MHILPTEFQDCKESRARAAGAMNAPYRGCRCLSQRVRVENGARTGGLLGFLDPVHLRGASLHANVVEEFGATLEEVATFLKTEGETKHPAQSAERRAARRLGLKMWLFSCSGGLLEELPSSFLSLAYLRRLLFFGGQPTL